MGSRKRLKRKRESFQICERGEFQNGNESEERKKERFGGSGG
jgi:hypothetical protein